VTTFDTPPQRPTSRSRTEASDRSLLLAVRIGDAGAYGELYRRYAGDARRYARSLAGPDDVEDVVAESFAKMLRAVRSGHGPVDRAAPYLMVAVRTSAATIHGRRARARAFDLKFAPTEAVMEDPSALVSDDQLVTAFRSLSRRWRQVIWWSVIEGMSPGEIGERLDINASAAAALTYRARRALQQAYERGQRGNLSE